jgi:hypothetical protein
LITDLYHDGNPHWLYEVDLERMKSSAKVLDVIAQISHKSWCSESILANLIWALDDCLGLQQNYCGFGIELKDK